MELLVLLFAGPVLSVVYFVSSLWLYIRDRRRNAHVPGSVEADKLHQRRSSLIYSSVILALVIAALCGLFALLYSAVAYM